VVTYSKAWFILIAVVMLATSCKLDNLPPGLATNANDDNTVLGIVVISKKIYNNYLTAGWKVSMTVLEYYDEDFVVVSGTITPNIFSGVAINDNAKTVEYSGRAANNGTYELSTDKNILFMKLPEDIFSRSENSPIRVTRLNATSMVWVAMDSNTIMMNGKSVYKAYRITFFK
jgi:hypothetical protein